MRQIADILRDLDGGNVYEELTLALCDLVQKVQERGKQGTLSFKLTVKPSGDGLTVQMVDELKITEPKEIRRPTLFFTTAGGDLLRSDPRQIEMPLRTVGETNKENVA